MDTTAREYLKEQGITRFFFGTGYVIITFDNGDKLFITKDDNLVEYYLERDGVETKLNTSVSAPPTP